MTWVPTALDAVLGAVLWYQVCTSHFIHFFSSYPEAQICETECCFGGNSLLVRCSKGRGWMASLSLARGHAAVPCGASRANSMAIYAK